MLNPNILKEGQRLMFITHPADRYTIAEEVRLLLNSGCSWIQLRIKEGLPPDTAKEVVNLCRSYNNEVIICIDDNIELALSCNASAVHLGKNDMPVSQARKLVKEQGKDHSFFIGATANTFEDIRKAIAEGASYIGLGPFRYTETKKKLSPILGLDGYRNILQKCKEAGIEIPIFAIGGIKLEDIKELMKTGISGVAVSGAIIRSENPVEETRRFIKEINTNIIL